MFTPEDHSGRSRRWLLDLTWGDVTYRLAEQDDRYTDSDNTRTDYYAGCVVTAPVERPAYIGEGPATPTATLELHLEHFVDVPARINEGLPLGSMRGVLWLWLEGTSHRERVVDGYVNAVEYGAKDQPVVCRLVDDRLRNRKRWPPATARMSSSKVNAGEYYPWIFGAPGSTTPDAYGSSGLVWSLDGSSNAEELLIAGHEVGAATVTVENGETGKSGSFLVSTTTGSGGRTVSIVDLTGGGGAFSAADRGKNVGYYVRWDGNGLAIRGAAVNGAGDVLRWALDRTEIAYDAGNLAALVPTLNRYQIDCRVVASPDRRVDLWTWVLEHLLPILPISCYLTSAGLRFVLWRFDATSSDASAHLVEGDNCIRAGDVGYGSRDDVKNTLRLNYGPGERLGSSVLSEVISGNPAVLAAESEASAFANCKASFLAYGEEDFEWSSDVVWDEDTAGRIVRERARREALQPRHIGYAAPPDVAAHLEPGDVVVLTDSELSITSALFFVQHKPAEAGEFFTLHLREITAP